MLNEILKVDRTRTFFFNFEINFSCIFSYFKRSIAYDDNVASNFASFAMMGWLDSKKKIINSHVFEDRKHDF